MAMAMAGRVLIKAKAQSYGGYLGFNTGIWSLSERGARGSARRGTKKKHLTDLDVCLIGF
jgi:hypothetical protein